MTRKISDWWPLCARCGKPVERLFIAEKARPDGTRDYKVQCHGQEARIRGMSRDRAHMMDLHEQRLQPAFVSQPRSFTEADLHEAMRHMRANSQR